MPMHVVKRDGRHEDVRLEKITKRVENLSGSLTVEPLLVAKKVIDGIFDGVTTRELDELAERTAANLVTTHPDYDFLAARLAASILHKETAKTFSEAMEKLASRKDSKGRVAQAISDELLALVRANRELIDATVVDARDLDFDYLGICTLKKSYLMRTEGKIVERPQYLWMRASLGIHGHDLARAFETYHLMSTKRFTLPPPPSSTPARPSPR